MSYFQKIFLMRLAFYEFIIICCFITVISLKKWRRQWHPTPILLPGKSRLSDFTFTFHFHALEEEMATHSSVLAWRIPVTGEPVGLPSMGSHRVGHNWSDLAAAAAAESLDETEHGRHSHQAGRGPSPLAWHRVIEWRSAEQGGVSLQTNSPPQCTGSQVEWGRQPHAKSSRWNPRDCPKA